MTKRPAKERTANLLRSGIRWHWRKRGPKPTYFRGHWTVRGVSKLQVFPPWEGVRHWIVYIGFRVGNPEASFVGRGAEVNAFAFAASIARLVQQQR